MYCLARKDHKTGRTQALKEHSLNVGDACAHMLMPIGLPALGRLAGYLHDMGKATREFQDYLVTRNTKLKGKTNHSYCGAKWLVEQSAVDLNAPSYRTITAIIISASICGHHSGLPDIISMDGKDILSEKTVDTEKANYHEAVSNFMAECFCERELHALFIQASAELKAFLISKADTAKNADIQLNKNPRINYRQYRLSEHAFFIGLVCRLIHGCLIDADRYDAYCFSLSRLPQPTPPLHPRWNTMLENLDEYCSAIPANRGRLYDLRRRIALECAEFANKKPGIYQLNIPTGGGKTLSAMRLALAHVQEHSMQKIFYIAPYKVILEQNAQVYRDALNCPGSVLEHHGDALLPPDLDDDALKEYELLLERWEGSEIILTSMVQFLNTLFCSKSSCSRRFHALIQSVIIIDEVQSIPARLVCMFNTACNFLVECLGCTIILCTATQPLLSKTPFPIRLSSPTNVINTELSTSPIFHRTQIMDRTSPALRHDEISSVLRDKCAEGKNVLAVFNTKRDAMGVYQGVKADNAYANRVFLLTASLCPAHRLDILKSISNILNDKDASPIICVSTQLIEAGVNISFDFVLRSLAGLDNVAQAAGRCDRNGECPVPQEVHIIKSENENLSRLSDIADAQAASRRALALFHQDPDKYGNDLLNQAIIDKYYDYYYQNKSDTLLYPVTSKDNPKILADTTIYSLFSGNHQATKNVKQAELIKRPLRQSFRTAGDTVEVIEESGYDVLVPYEQGENLIAKIEDCKDISELKSLLRASQRYMVHIYQGDYIRLKGYALREIGPGVLALAQGHYDENLGILMEPGTLVL